VGVGVERGKKLSGAIATTVRQYSIEQWHKESGTVWVRIPNRY